MLRHIKLSSNQRIAAVCSFSTLAVAGLIGGIYSLGAFADGSRFVNVPNTTVDGQNFTWTFENNETLTLAMTTGPTVHDNDDNNDDNSIEYGDENVMLSLTHTGESNACDNYNAVLSAEGWDGYTLQCNTSEGSQEFFTDQNFTLPNNIGAAVLDVYKKGNNNQNPSAPLIVSIAADSFENDGKTANFAFGDDSRSITFTNAWNAQNNPHFEFENNGDNSALKATLASGLSFTAGGPCMDGEADNYIVKFGSREGWNRVFTCNNGDYTLQFSDDEAIPSNGLNVWIESANQPGPAQDYYVEFENVDTVSDNQDYVLVTSRDQSLAGKTWRLTPSSGTIGCTGDEQGTHCGITFADNPFADESDFFVTIAGEGFDLNTEEIMIFLRGPAGANGVAQISKVGNNYQFMLRGNNFPDEVHNISIDIEEPHSIEPGPEPRVHPGDPVPATTVTVKKNLGNPNIVNSFYLSRIEINYEPVFNTEDCEWSREARENPQSCPETFTRENFVYNKEANADTVEIDIGTIFNLRLINNIKINGESYNIPFDYTNRQQWLAHYDHQMTGFTLTVPYSADGYVIEIDADELEGRYQQIGNFLWTNDENEKTDPEGRANDAYIGHSNLEVVSVDCHITENDENDVFFRVGIDEVPEGCVFEYQPDDDRHPTGSLVVPEGSTITVRLKPQYGWQVTSFKISGDDEIRTDPGAVAQYTLGILRGNAHMGAVVTKVDDEVNAISDKIKSGSISLGGEEIDEGTAMLSVNDADLTDEQKDEFQKQAGNYNVSTFLDIDLDQVFYDGKGGYWQGEEMSELAHEATITLTLEEGVDGNSVILVHKKHDGTYEIIPTTYDAKTHTITFKTSSFSDYAIASATVKNTNTFDNIIRYFILFAVSSVAAVFFATRKVQETSK